jgi:hypothetical protein
LLSHRNNPPRQQVTDSEREDTGSEAEDDDREADDRRIDGHHFAQTTADPGNLPVVFRSKEPNHGNFLERFASIYEHFKHIQTGLVEKTKLFLSDQGSL